MDNKPLYKDSLIVMFITISLVFGIMFSILIPVPRIQDEKAHFINIIANSGMPEYITLFPQEYSVSGPVNDTIAANKNLENKPFTDIEDYKRAFLAENNIGIHIIERPNPIKLIPYFPSVIGFFIGAALKLPLLYIFLLLDIFSLAFYTIMGVITLRTTPIKRDLFFFVLLLPSALTLAASSNYDCVLFSLTTFNTAYILKLKIGKEKIGFKDLLLLCLTTFAIAVTKIPYVLLSAFLFMIPLSKFNLVLNIRDKKIDLAAVFKKIRIPLFIFIFVVFIVGVFTIDSPTLKTLAAAISSPKDASMDIIRTVIAEWKYYLQQIALCIGHFDYVASLNFMLFLYVALLVCTFYREKGGIQYRFSTINKAFIWFILFLIVIMIILSQYIWQLKMAGFDLSLSISDYKAFFLPLEKIVGVQGRYFIPLIIPASLTFDFVNISFSSRKLRIYEAFVYIVFFYYCLRGLLTTYWL